MNARDREAQIRRVTWVGLIVNVALAALKLAAGLLGHSRAVVADAVHTVSDCATDVAVLVGSRLWSQPRDEDHPYGHARIEAVITAVIGLLLAAVGIGIGYDAIASMHRKHTGPPGLVALLAALASIAVKEALCRWTMRAGRQAHSSAVVANAWHHRSDALSSVPAALAVGGAMVLPAWTFLDHIGAIAVCLLIVQAAYRIVLPAVGQLIDTALPLDERAAILRGAQECEGVEVAHALRTRQLGSGIAIDLHIEVEPTLTVTEAHDIAEHVRECLTERFPDIIDVVIHVEPLGHVSDRDQRPASPR